MDRHVHAYQKMYIVWGRKPEAHEIPRAAPAPSAPISHPSATHAVPTADGQAGAESTPSEVPLPASPVQSQPPPQVQSQFPLQNSNNLGSGDDAAMGEAPHDFASAHSQSHRESVH